MHSYLANDYLMKSVKLYVGKAIVILRISIILRGLNRILQFWYDWFQYSVNVGEPCNTLETFGIKTL
jgi:hypothetical protein